MLGVAVGISYAATAALLKSVTNIALRGPVPVLTSWQLYAVIASGATGLLLNQVAFRAGPLTASLPAIATVDPLLSIALGIVVFHEHIHHGTFQGLWLSSLVLLIGVAAIQLARSGQEANARAAALARAAAEAELSPVAVVGRLTTPAPIEVVPEGLPGAGPAPTPAVTGVTATVSSPANGAVVSPGLAGSVMPVVPAASMSMLVAILPLLARFLPRVGR